MPREQIDEMWMRVKEALEAGQLGRIAKVSTAKPSPIATDEAEQVICVYTHDADDEADVMCIRESLRAIGITWRIPYKTDEATMAGQYKIRGHKRISKYYV